MYNFELSAATAPQVEFLPDEVATVAYGEALGRCLVRQFDGNALVFLQGNLGAGKTTLVRGILRSLGHSGAVKSPTYTLLEPAACNGQDAYHFDLYRVNDPQELSFVGFDEIIDGPGLKFVEWAEKAQAWLPAPDLMVRLRVCAKTDLLQPLPDQGAVGREPEREKQENRQHDVGREITVEFC